MKKITTDLLIFSHKRWEPDNSRHQHFSIHFAKHRRVFFVEEPIIGVSKIPLTLIKETDENVQIVLPYLPDNLSPFEQKNSLQELISKVMEDENIKVFTLWYNHPKALGFTRHLSPHAVFYDCNSDLSSHILGEVEKELINKADVLITGSQDLYSIKKSLHSSTHYFPDGIESANKILELEREVYDKNGFSISSWERLKSSSILNPKEMLYSLMSPET